MSVNKQLTGELTYQNLRTIMAANNYNFFDKGNYNLNLIFARNTQFTDGYTDMLYIAYKENMMEKVIMIPCSTKAGSYYFKLNPFKLNKRGVSVIKEGQYSQTWQYKTSLFLGKPYLHLVKDIPVYRDGNKDNFIDTAVVEVGNYGNFIHTAGDIKGNIYNWSAGCMVIPKEYYSQFLQIIEKAVSLYGDLFTVTILKNY